MFSVLADVLPSIANQLFSLPVIFSLVLGVIGGLIIGALPGLSATMGVALMIPFTYGMNPIAAIVMLMAIYTSAITGGSVSAILICTPGTPASAATAIDGYPLTEQGKGLKALGVSIISSTIGGLFSGFCLLLISPLLASLSLKFGAPEYFLLAVFGLSIIASLASESLVKGLAAGFLGVVISTIGIDNDSAFPRFTFDSLNLMGGIPPVPALIGLFSIAEFKTVQSR
jgi:putative tricarboxylic transport membrane protein